ncbi:LacI family DNA-binding transcriptional regulator [Falsibacillus albus]|uniref:LacI family transcriptional regulator n=1 Tax=Falsibacillus albus TaxID=2478915 RepID=A0A3L7K5B9_9BACI|nr:LacI family DNA-binding transcriptional regulator [Falsibacillus albus]RLQ97479.1 LacI family transcriptional regulator [Falsibacillus albus]
MATISDVARLSGLSRSTVSRVLNNYPYVSEEKKRLVNEAMEQLNYFPNASAQKLRNQKTETIAVLIPMLTNPFFAYLLQGIDTIATENGFQLLVCQTRYDKEKELNFLNLLKSKQVDGIILTSIENSWDQLEPFLKYGPIVMCNEYEKTAKNVPSVRLDQVYGGYIATRHLIEKGHSTIAYCRGAFRSGIASDREIGYRLALEEFNLPYREELMFRAAADSRDGEEVFKKLMTLKERPTGIFTGSDQVAAGIIKQAKLNGIEVPKELAVVGFDDQPIAEIVVPEITTVKQPIHEIGEKAMGLMLNLLLPNESDSIEEVELQLQLIERAST